MSDVTRGIAFRLYQRVAAERAAQGLTWTDLHQRSGVARSTVAAWARGQTPPKPATVNAVADTLGIPRAEALRLAGVLSDIVPADAPVCTFEQSILGEAGLSDDTKAQVILVHRQGGHSNCRPLAEDAAGRETALSAAR